MSGVTWLDIEEWYRKFLDLPPPLREIKLTNEQVDELRRNTTAGHVEQPGLLDIPIIVVDTVEESTPHQLGSARLEYEAAYRAALEGNQPTRVTFG